MDVPLYDVPFYDVPLYEARAVAEGDRAVQFEPHSLR
jgi:hypothetical protein